ncbi:MAG: hypothetical protein M3X11_01185 [Acidobacteriota bacterium]|nr:hypothetical protein [Acidobacteriota bacterium]
MIRVRLIHWKAAEAAERIETLRAAGYEVEYSALDGDGYRTLRFDPPAAFVIDLSRLPSQGRDVGVGLRGFKATRAVPIVFVEGEPEKIGRIKQILPDAIYTTWGRIRSALKAAIAKPLTNPIKPESNLAGYSSTPLPKKLGIKPNSIVALINAPKDFVTTLGELPEGVKFIKSAKGHVKGNPELIVWFIRMRIELEERINEMRGLTGNGGLWIAWPKKAARKEGGVASDLTENIVRDTGLAVGLVDYKVCAIDATWSGLKFAVRKAK